MTEKKKLIRDWGIKGSGEILRKGIGFIVTAVAARKLTSAEFGEYNTLFTITNMVALLFDFGLNTVLIREIAQNKSRDGEFFTGVSLIRSGLAIVMVVIISIFAHILPFYRENVLPLYAFSLFWIATIVNEMIGSVYAGYQEFHREAYVLLGQKVLFTIFACLFLFGGLGYNGFIYIHPITAILGAALSFMYLRHRGLRLSFPGRELIWYAIKESFPIAISLTFSLLYFKADIIVLRYFHGPSEVGYYSAAYKILELLMAVPATLIAVLFPVLARKAGEGAMRRVVKRGFIYLSILSIISSICVSLASHFIIRVIYGTAYESAAKVLIILTFAFALIFLNYFFIYALIALKQQRLNMLSSGICLVCNITLNLVLIPKWRMYGAALTTVLTELVLFGLGLYFCATSTKVFRQSGD